MGYWGYGGYPPYVSVGEKKAKTAKKLKQLKKRNPDIRPIVIKGTAIARTWWGKSWNLNLERYADYSNRIGRGRSYVRHGAVLDLQIESGEVKSLVQGTASKPYSVTIKIKGILKDSWKNITSVCQGKLDSLQELLMGKFPRALGEIFTAQGIGLFPSPKEIEFSCSCPDSAYMCKHVAATLYGIGARLDEEPNLFFKLRKAKINELVSQAVEDKTQELLKKAKKKTARVIADFNLSDVFGIDLEEDIDLAVSTVKPSKKSSAAKRTSKSPAKKARTKDQRRRPGAKPVKKTAATKVSAVDTVLSIITRSRKGVDTSTLRNKTGFDAKKIWNIISRLKKQGKVKSEKKGVYVKV